MGSDDLVGSNDMGSGDPMGCGDPRRFKPPPLNQPGYLLMAQSMPRPTILRPSCRHDSRHDTPPCPHELRHAPSHPHGLRDDPPHPPP